MEESKIENNNNQQKNISYFYLQNQDNDVIRLSEAFPPDQNYKQISCQNQENGIENSKLKEQPEFLATVHQQIQEGEFNKDSLRNLQFIQIVSKQQLEEIQNLHKEWFPVQYQKQFFNQIIEGKSTCIACQCKIKQKNRLYSNIIIGLIVFKIKEISKKYMKIPFYQMFLNQELHSIYIMTIGVINEVRRLGIATKMLSYVENTYMQQIKFKYIYLHVVSYNNSAIKFYNKSQFILLSTKKNHYLIGNKYYDALSKIIIQLFCFINYLVFAKYYNGGIRPTFFFANLYQKLVQIKFALQKFIYK